VSYDSPVQNLSLTSFTLFAVISTLKQQGVRKTPTRLRVRLSRKRNDDDESDSKLYTLVSVWRSFICLPQLKLDM
jgi:hypothetical protein